MFDGKQLNKISNQGYSKTQQFSDRHMLQDCLCLPTPIVHQKVLKCVQDNMVRFDAL